MRIADSLIRNSCLSISIMLSGPFISLLVYGLSLRLNSAIRTPHSAFGSLAWNESSDNQHG
jgi:hypothetical protein